MTEKELIGKLQKLRQIKPGKDWAISTKTQILGETPGFNFFSYFKLPSVSEGGRRRSIFFAPALAGVVFVFVIFGLFGFSQNSVPGDFLYTIKKIIEKGQAVFVSEQEKPQASLELANKRLNKRLEELTKIAEANQVKKLAPAIAEFQTSISEVAKNLSKSSDPITTKEIVDGIGDKVQTISAYLGADVGGEEFEKLKQRTDVDYVEYLISDLETRTLTEEKEEALNQMKELVKEGKYSEALELYLVKINQ